MLEKVVSGGQRGADQAGLRAARSSGLPTGGWAPRGWLVESPGGRGFISDPSLAGWGLIECQEEGFPARTKFNARDSDGTIWFGANDGAGFGCTMNACRAAGKPAFVVKGNTTPEDVARWIEDRGITILNVAGNRASKAPVDFGDRVERFLVEVFRILGHGATRGDEA